MASSAWRCSFCRVMNKGSAVHCPWCGRHWQAAMEQQPSGYTGWSNAPKSPRRPKSPRATRQRPQAPAGGKAKGKTKYSGGEPEPHTWTPTAPPWKPATEGKGQPASSSEDPKVQELLGAIRASFATQSMPAAVAEAIAKVEKDNGKILTKNLHSQTTQLGAAKKQLLEIRRGRAAQEAAWVDFLTSTVTSWRREPKNTRSL